MTDGFATSQIIQVIGSTINDRRMNNVGRKPIKTEEFMNELALQPPIFAEQEDAFTQWFEKTPIGRVVNTGPHRVGYHLPAFDNQGAFSPSLHQCLIKYPKSHTERQQSNHSKVFALTLPNTDFVSILFVLYTV